MIYIDQPRRTASDKILHDKAFKIASNLKYNGYKRGLAYMLYKVFDQKARVTSIYIVCIYTLLKIKFPKRKSDEKNERHC